MLNKEVRLYDSGTVLTVNGLNGSPFPCTIIENETGNWGEFIDNVIDEQVIYLWEPLSKLDRLLGNDYIILWPMMRV